MMITETRRRLTASDPCSSEPQRPPIGVFLIIGCLLGAAAAMAAPYGFSESYGNLLRLDLLTGDAEVVGSTGLNIRVRGDLTLGPGGALFGLGLGVGGLVLLRIDPVSGGGEVVAALPTLPSQLRTIGIATTADGALWVVANDHLFRIDVGGAAAPPIILQQSIGPMASHGRELFGFSPDGVFQRIDTTTGALKPIFTFDEPSWTPVGASFDDAGELWLLAGAASILSEVVLGVYHVADLGAGNFEQTFYFSFHLGGDFRAGMLSLALPLPRRQLCYDPTVLCLGEFERFAVNIEWADFVGNTGPALPVEGTRTTESGLFYFFDASNWEVLIKVLDGCGFNDHYWVFAAATTNVAYTITVTDTFSGRGRTYSNPLGTAAAAITDTAAFATCGLQ